MFINHCRDQNLALSFQLKAPEKRTGPEVQDRLDSHVRKTRISVVHSQNARCVSALGQGPADVTCHTAITVPVPVTCETTSHPMSSLSSTAAIGQPQSPDGAVNLRLTANFHWIRLRCFVSLPHQRSRYVLL